MSLDARRFTRTIEPTLIKAVSSFPVVVLTGPRQSGKTTVLKNLFPDHTYVSLESPDQLLNAQADPRGFLGSAQKWIIDEAQNFPSIFSYIQEIVDKSPKPGMFILSGSQNFLLAEHISQTLAGRAAVLELLGLTHSEYLSHPGMKKRSVWDYIFHGSYPRPYHEGLDFGLWYQSYIRTYIERDVRSLINIRDLSTFQVFIKLCAGRHGQLLNLSSLAQDCGISQTTASDWLSILEASYIVFRLRPHFRNFNKRLVKTPKLYFYDSALACMALSIENPEHLLKHASRGAIFEGFVIAEIIKLYWAQGKTAPVYFWRDHLGTEVDVVIEKGESLLPIEIKSTETFMPALLDSLKKWSNISGEPLSNATSIYAGGQKFVNHGISVLPWNEFQSLFPK